MNEEALYDKIDQYLSKKLEDKDFYNQLAQDASLREMVEIEKTLRDAVIDHSVLQVREELLSIRNEVAKERKRQNSWRWTGLVLLVSTTFVGAYFYLEKGNQAPVAKANMNFTASPELVQKESPLKTDQPSKVESEAKALLLTKPQTEVALEPDTFAREVVESPEQENVPTNELQGNTPFVSEQSPEEKTNKEVLKKLELGDKPSTSQDLTPSIAKKPLENHIFEPTNETWKVPIAENKSGVFMVMDKTGEVVYRMPFGMNEYMNWDGTSSKGTMLKAGLYAYVLDYMDGSADRGTVTLSY